MSDEKPVRWERRLADCPHCGRRVLFSGQGVCPSCNIRGDAPVTDEDHARIEADREAQLRAAEAPPRSTNGGFGSGVAVGFLFGLVALLLVHWLSQDAELKRGAGYGFGGRLVVGALVMFATLAAG